MALGVIAQLPARDIVALAQTCMHFRNLILDEQTITTLLHTIEASEDEQRSRRVAFTLFPLLDLQDPSKLTCVGCMARHPRGDFVGDAPKIWGRYRFCTQYPQLQPEHCPQPGTAAVWVERTRRRQEPLNQIEASIRETHRIFHNITEMFARSTGVFCIKGSGSS
jgi:hypothetical protein